MIDQNPIFLFVTRNFCERNSFWWKNDYVLKKAIRFKQWSILKSWLDLFPILPTFSKSLLRLNLHCVKHARIQVFSDPYFPVEGQNIDSVPKKENMDQRKPVFWHILRSFNFYKPSKFCNWLRGVHFLLFQWARNIVATSVFCWIFIAMYTNYMLRLKWLRYMMSLSNNIMML